MKYLILILLLLLPLVNAEQYTVSCESNSMYPTLQCDDKVFATSRPPLITEGDIIIFKNPFSWGKEELIVHRIIRIEPEYYTTQGDNSNSTERFPKEYFVARVVGYQRNNIIKRLK